MQVCLFYILKKIVFLELLQVNWAYFSDLKPQQIPVF